MTEVATDSSAPAGATRLHVVELTGDNSQFLKPVGDAHFSFGVSGKIFRLIPQAKQKIKQIQKLKLRPTGKNDDNKGDANGYMFRGIDDVLNAIGPVFDDLGIVCSTRHHNAETKAIIVEKAGYGNKPNYQQLTNQTTLSLVVRLYADDGSWWESQAFGMGTDYGDGTCAAKAESLAYKSAVLLGLAIPINARDLPEPDGDEQPGEGENVQATPATEVPKSQGGKSEQESEQERLYQDMRKRLQDAWENKNLELCEKLLKRFLNSDKFTEKHRAAYSELANKCIVNLQKAIANKAT